MALSDLLYRPGAVNDGGSNYTGATPAKNKNNGLEGLIDELPDAEVEELGPSTNNNTDEEGWFYQQPGTGTTTEESDDEGWNYQQPSGSGYSESYSYYPEEYTQSPSATRRIESPTVQPIIEDTKRVVSDIIAEENNNAQQTSNYVQSVLQQTAASDNNNMVHMPMAPNGQVDLTELQKAAQATVDRLNAENGTNLQPILPDEAGIYDWNWRNNIQQANIADSIKNTRIAHINPSPNGWGRLGNVIQGEIADRNQILANIANSLYGSVENGVQNISEGINQRNELIPKIGSRIGDAISNYASNVSNGISRRNELVSGIANRLGGLIEDYAGNISNGIATRNELIPQIGNQIGSSISNGINERNDILAQLGNSAIEGLSNGVSNFRYGIDKRNRILNNLLTDYIPNQLADSIMFSQNAETNPTESSINQAPETTDFQNALSMSQVEDLINNNNFEQLSAIDLGNQSPLEAAISMNDGAQDFDADNFQNWYGIYSNYGEPPAQAIYDALGKAKYDYLMNNQTGLIDKAGMWFENRWNQYVKDPYEADKARWEWIQKQPEYMNASTENELIMAEEKLGNQYDQMIEKGEIQAPEKSPIVSSNDIRNRRNGSAREVHEKYYQDRYSGLESIVENVLEGFKENYKNDTQIRNRAETAAQQAGLSPYTVEGERFIKDYISQQKAKTNADAISDLTIHLTNLGYAPDTASYVARYSVENNVDPETVVKFLTAQQYGLENVIEQNPVNTYAEGTGGGKRQADLTEQDFQNMSDISKQLQERGYNQLDANNIADYAVRYGTTADEAANMFKQGRLEGMVYEAPGFDADGNPNATMQAILNGEFSIDLEAEGLERGTDYYEVARQGNAERILHLFDSADGFTGLVIPKGYEKFFASDSNSAIGAGKVAVWGENGIQITGNPNNVELVKASGEELVKAVDAFIQANPQLQVMIQNGLLTRDDIMSHFFKGITETKEDDSNSKKSYGGGGGYKKSSSGGSRRGGYGGGGGSSNYGYAPSDKEQRQARVNNIMKNWTF